MRTISARQFRLGFGTPAIAEPVQVVRRDPDGALTVLGEWHPAVNRTPSTPKGGTRPNQTPTVHQILEKSRRGT